MLKQLQRIFVLLASGLAIFLSLNCVRTQTVTDSYNPAVLYSEAIRSGNIISYKYSYESFRNNMSLFRRQYDDLINTKQVEPSQTSFQSWLQQNDYGAFSDGAAFDYTQLKKQVTVSSNSQEDNARQFERTLQNGDVVIEGGSSSSGPFIGHVAIATTSHIILEMTGGPKWASGINDNNHQYMVGDWLRGLNGSRRHINNWLRIYRLANRNVANQSATWADWRFYSSSHGWAKNRHIKYLINTQLHVLTPTTALSLYIRLTILGAEIFR